MMQIKENLALSFSLEEIESTTLTPPSLSLAGCLAQWQAMMLNGVH